MRLKVLLAVFLVFAAGCRATTEERTLVLQYTDFGPQAACWEYIGMEWWQWEPHGDSNPRTRYDIKVVVYKKMPLAQVQKMHPVDPGNKKDYRYLPYKKAMEYLDKRIEEDALPEVTARLRRTKGLILDKMGK